jgi:hypothetical protein
MTFYCLEWRRNLPNDGKNFNNRFFPFFEWIKAVLEKKAEKHYCFLSIFPIFCKVCPIVNAGWWHIFASLLKTRSKPKILIQTSRHFLITIIMKTLRVQMTNLLSAIFFIAVSMLFSNGVQAQETERGHIISMNELTIKPGHDNQFKEGVKAWKACYLENGGEWTWNLWSRMNGEGNVYILTSAMDSWAEMDETGDEAGMKCYALVRDLINPHIESSETNFARFMPQLSRTNADLVIQVTYWQVNNWAKFLEIVNEITDEVIKAEGTPRGLWYNVLGGSKDSPDVLLVYPFANFAAMDVERDRSFTIYEKAKGKEKRDEMQAAFREVTDASWSYIFRRNEDLSHNPPAE